MTDVSQSASGTLHRSRMAEEVLCLGWFNFGSVKKDIRYVPTPWPVVEAMLDLAELTSRDVLYDLGSGDGSLVMSAARRGAPGVGIDIDKRLVLRSQGSALAEGLSELAHYRVGNLFEVDLRPATVVTIYLGYGVNMALRPKLLAELQPGTRLVSHSFDMEDWLPDREVMVETKLLFLWTVPAKA